MVIVEYDPPNSDLVDMVEMRNRPLPDLPTNSNTYNDGEDDNLSNSQSIEPPEQPIDIDYCGLCCCCFTILILIILIVTTTTLVITRVSPSRPEQTEKPIGHYIREPHSSSESRAEGDEVNPTIICSTGYTFFKETDQCYKITVRPSTFAKAIRSCEFDGGNLASVHSELENDFIVSLYHKTLKVYRKEVDLRMRRQDVWIGMVYENEKWHWTDGTSVDYLNWAPGEPNLMDTEFWTVIVTYRNSGNDPEGNTWHNIVSENRAFVCKKKPTSCPHGYTWLQHSGFCYKVITAKSTFKQADNECKEEGAQLASIHSTQENTFLANFSRKNDYIYNDHITRTSENDEVIIGLVFKDNKWQWTDGTPLDYTNWAEGEPNRMDLQEHTTTLITSRTVEVNPEGDHWNNVQDHLAQRAFICKKTLL